MDREMNPFALLGEDDDGDNDLSALITTAAAKIPRLEKKPSPDKEKEKSQPAKLPSKPLPPAEAVRAERGRGRGAGRGRGRSFGGGEFSSEFGGRGGGRGFGESSDGFGGRGGGRGFGDLSNGFGGRGGGRGFGEEDGGGGGTRGFGRGRGRGRGRVGGRFGGGAPYEANGSGDSPRPQFEPDATADQWQTTEVSAEEHKTVELEVKKPEEEITREISVENKEENKDEEDKEMTLEEYEKLMSEKRKALEASKNEERKVVLDRDFESMQLVHKKKDDDIFIKLNSEKEKLRKKENIDKEEKARKAVSINEFLKPADGEKYYGALGARGRGRGRGGGRGRGNDTITRGSFTGRFNDVDEVAAPHIEDPVQFPLLAAK